MTPGGATAPDIFISYAGPDRERADALGERLERAGARPWWDARLSPDEPFEQQIQRVLASARIVVAVLSPRTLDSEWVRWELSQASRNGVHLMPLLVDDARPADLPPPLHLLPRLVSDGSSAALDAAAAAVKRCLDTLARTPPRSQERDARRRLASAAAHVARQAADIRQRKASAAALPPVVVRGAGDPTRAAEAVTRYSASPGFAAFLREQGIALALSSPHTDELLLLGHAPGGQLVVDVQGFRQPTGLAYGGGSLLVGTLGHLLRLENILQPGQRLDGLYSHCLVPRTAHCTGRVDTHDVALGADGQALFIATRYNCLATTSPVHSFRPLWRPAFIGDLVAEDRCHLNGLALRDGQPAYVTAVSTSDHHDGWRDALADGGVVIDVRSGTVVCSGLSLPHSPRLHDDGRLWVLDSGRGRLGWIDTAAPPGEAFRPVAQLPGLARGLCLQGHWAIVGLSRPRHDIEPGPGHAGEPVLECFRPGRDAAWCGLQVIDLADGRCAHGFRLDGAAREVYDVAVLPGIGCARSVSPQDDDGLDLVTVEEGPVQARAAGFYSSGSVHPSP